MRGAGVLVQRREGTTVHYRLADARVIKAFDIIRQVLRDGISGKNTTAREAAL